MTEFETIIDCLLDVARRSPNSCAVMSAGECVYTYAQLVAGASTIAAALRRAGAKRETVVGIFIEKSPEYVMSMLGIWLCGAAFVPIDPKLPQERISFILQEAEIEILVAKSVSVLDSFGSSLRIISCDVESNGGTGAGSSHGPVGEGDVDSATRFKTATIEESDLAYIIFTSGSTGQPKGVMVEHRGIVNFIKAQIRGFRLDSSSRALFYLSTNFDASVSDIGTALLSGGTLCMESEDDLKPGAKFVRMIHERQITHMDIPPSVLAMLDPSEMPDSLSTVIIGGEACAPQAVRAFARRFHVVNVYGPTESTVCTSFCDCDAETWNLPFIGSEIPNVTYNVFDESFQETPEDTPGELFIAGIGLARGYLKRPDLTAQKFVDVNGVRMYRSGDLVRKHKSGEFEFLGRVDRQFKIRGLLVEPEEIEARLKEIPGVYKAAVLKRFLNSASKREALVAFISVDPSANVTKEALRERLAMRLPRWMIPQHFEFLAQMPMTLTGKNDMEQLKSGELERETGESSRPLTDLERQIADVWQEVLALDEIGIDDDFFDLGGDSFGVIEAAAAAEARGLHMPPALLMNFTKLADLAVEISARRSTNSLVVAEGAMTSKQLREDVALSEEWMKLVEGARRRSDALPGKPETVLVTGAAGFLGSRLVWEFLNASSAEVICLVRASDEAQAKMRILTAISDQELQVSVEQEARIVAVCGDLERPHFGIGDARWNELTERVDMVIHCAARVNMVLDYNALRPSNVGGTFEVIRFLAEGRRKSLHYASTLSVFVATDRNEGVALESDELQQTKFVYGGYAQTKYASEVLLRSVTGIAPIAHYRLGLITGDAASGATSDTDFLVMFIKGIRAIGCVPSISKELSVDVTPIDYCAEAMRRIALADPGVSRTYHIANPKSLRLDVLIECMRNCGIAVTSVSAEEFIARAQAVDLDKSAAAAACLALCRSLDGVGTFESLRTMDLFQATNIEFDTRNTEACLRGDLSCPEPDSKLIETYVRAAIS